MTNMMTAKQIHEKAAEIVNGDRQSDYGHPRDNHGCTAALWNAYIARLSQDGLMPVLDAVDVCVLNILQKLSRFANKRTEDCIVDSLGYCLNIAMIGEQPDVDTGVDNELPAATDTPANSEAVEREDGPVVRCFESVIPEPPVSHLVQLWRLEPSAHIYVNGDGESGEDYHKDRTGDSLLDSAIAWREFPPAEWDAKVAAVKAAAQPHNPAVVPHDPPHNADVVPSEWPKWTNFANTQVRVYGENGSAHVRATNRDHWEITKYAFECERQITRAEAVRLIGEAAVVEGERLAGVATDGRAG